jgi:cytochrome c biogenesis protein CcmG, thiol:disulfide interchange protein DsbE
MSRASKNRRPPRSKQRPAPPRRSMTPFVLGGVAAVVVVAAIAAVVIAGSSPSGPSEPASQPVAVSGDHLPALTDPSADPAAGLQLPRISGQGVDGQALEIGPDDGPMAIVILAHWCPHCQAELPALAEYIAQGAVPNGVRVVGLSTAIDPVRPNYPPSAWFEREGWTQPTLVDDADNTALNALGVNNFPGFVFVDADGRVTQRLTGEIGVEQFAQILASLAP